DELLASGQSLEEMRQFIAADSLAFISLEGLYEAVGGQGRGHCDACFSGAYPIRSSESSQDLQLTLLDGLE
ncbi:MAG: amidophosphoribosyltransferase, partial [Magnetococcus sp. THC-1_WYH]